VTDVAEAADRILTNIVGYAAAALVTPIAIALQALRVRNDHSFREKLAFALPLMIIVEAIIAGLFVYSEFSDILIVKQDRRFWGIYASLLGLATCGGLAFVVLRYIRESRRAYDILDASEETAATGVEYSQTTVMAWKAFVLWLLAALFAVGWLNEISHGRL
jgi:amino acid transporter